MGRGRSPGDLSHQRCWFQSLIKRVPGIYTSNVYTIRMSNVSVVFFKVQTCYSIDNQGNGLTAKCMALNQHQQKQEATPSGKYYLKNGYGERLNPALFTTTLARGYNESFKIIWEKTWLYLASNKLTQVRIHNIQTQTDLSSDQCPDGGEVRRVTKL